MSKAVRFYEAGGPEVLKLVDVEVPRPNRGEVRISRQGHRPEPS
jgi:NADPH:quinone reductase